MKKIVFVEDDIGITEALGMVFTPPEWLLTIYPSGQEIVAGKVEVPGLFILDKNLPGINGLDLCRFIKSSEQYGQVPVLMVSATVNLAALASDAGADGWLTKPFQLSDLRKRINTFFT